MTKLKFDKLNKLQLGKVNKILDQPRLFSSGERSWREFFNNQTVIRKDISILTHSEKKINLEYKELKNPKIRFNIHMETKIYYIVPKLIYDVVDAPIEITEYDQQLYNKHFI